MNRWRRFPRSSKNIFGNTNPNADMSAACGIPGGYNTKVASSFSAGFTAEGPFICVGLGSPKGSAVHVRPPPVSQRLPSSHCSRSLMFRGRFPLWRGAAFFVDSRTFQEPVFPDPVTSRRSGHLLTWKLPERKASAMALGTSASESTRSERFSATLAFISCSTAIASARRSSARARATRVSASA